MTSTPLDLSRPDGITDEQREMLRRHYLAYAKAESEQGRRLSADLARIYAAVDELCASESLSTLVSALHTSAHVVLFCTDSSTLALREFRLAMLSEGTLVRVVSESASDTNGIAALSKNDLLIVVTTSNGFAHRQRANIERSEAYKVILTANDDPKLHAGFDRVLSIGQGAEEGSPMHRIYATYGVTYFFDRLYTLYARAYDPAL
ncbi:hypothetical protein [Olsenella massiliensis]|uniref:hypothetical protein n=1 Tax=Olsenella massiliensis TaxID=1622075 RepID=UPI00071DD6B1|nr:hypothetical protein [Olsenella massiliensis]